MKLRLLAISLALPLAAGAPQAPTSTAPARRAAPAADPAPAVPPPAKGMHRYMIVRTFPAGALAGLDAKAKKAVNHCNLEHGVHWVYSFANADKTKTFCIYDGPSEQAIRDAAAANKIPVDEIVEIPVVLRAH
ncbi:MAG TPA: DUF4242 domain-containing protein [Holophagaceae bacterium]|nr:DUF4242 domain-containing protein [Holophagaceae bacterium]